MEELWERETIHSVRADVLSTGGALEINEKYTVSRHDNTNRLFKGNYANVMLCKGPGGNFMVIKEWGRHNLERMEDRGLEDAMNEIRITSLLKHPKIVKAIEVIIDPQWDSIYMISEYMKNGQSMTWFPEKMCFKTYDGKKCFDKEKARKLFKDALEGLAYLHSLLIIHRDIKPQNILVNASGVGKLMDFSESKQFEPSAEPRSLLVPKSDTKGTSHFNAPEIYHGDESYYDGFATDIWAMGITLHAFLCGNLPFKQNSMTRMKFEESLRDIKFDFKRKVKGYVSERTPVIKNLCEMLGISVAGEDLRILQKILQRDPKLRPTAKELLDDQYMSSV